MSSGEFVILLVVIFWDLLIRVVRRLISGVISDCKFS